MLRFIQKSVICFVEQNKWLISIWNATLGWNGLTLPKNIRELLMRVSHVLRVHKNRILIWNELNDHQSKIMRSRHWRSSVRKGVLRNFAKFTEKHLCQSIFFKCRCSFIKKGTLVQVFSCEFYEISKDTFFTKPFSGNCFWVLNYNKLRFLKARCMQI